MVNISFHSCSVSHIVLARGCCRARFKWTFTRCFTRSFRGQALLPCAAHNRLKDARFQECKSSSQQPAAFCCPLTGCEQQSNICRDAEATNAGLGSSLSSPARFMACCSALAAMPRVSVRGDRAHRKVLQIEPLCLATLKYWADGSISRCTSLLHCNNGSCLLQDLPSLTLKTPRDKLERKEGYTTPNPMS